MMAECALCTSLTAENVGRRLILADQAEHSMAAAHHRNIAAGDTDYITIDGGFTAPRNAHGCTMARTGPMARSWALCTSD